MRNDLALLHILGETQKHEFVNNNLALRDVLAKTKRSGDGGMEEPLRAREERVYLSRWEWIGVSSQL